MSPMALWLSRFKAELAIFSFNLLSSSELGAAETEMIENTAAPGLPSTPSQRRAKIDHISVLKKYKCKYTHTERSGVIQPGTLSVGTGGLGGGVR